MEFLKIVFISIFQGISEFLPISSSGHILLLKKLLGVDFGLSFDLTIHLGTVFSVIVVFNKEISELIRGLFSKKSFESAMFRTTMDNKLSLRILLFLIIATIPAGIAGFFLKDFIESRLIIENRETFLILAGFFTVTMIYLALSALNKKLKSTKPISRMDWKKSLIIGLFQMTAVFPGISRSGSTISGSLIAGIDKEDAGRFSFLLSIPLITAAFLLETVDLIRGKLEFSSSDIFLYVIGFVASFIMGCLALKLLLNTIRKGKIWCYSFYMIVPITISMLIYFLS